MNEENQSASPALFAENSTLAAQRDAAAVARATQEIQASLVIAKKFPRDEIGARAKILQACERKGLAEVAEYEFSRGGQTIIGPTVDLMRAIAKRWGNLLFGWSEVERRQGESSVRTWAWDVESNARAERTFVIAHWRDTKSGGYQLEDERDIYELIANMAARRVRACLEEIIDADIVEDAVNQCRTTMKKAAGAEPLAHRLAKAIMAFTKWGVTQAMIETRMQKKVEAFSEQNLASLRRIWKSLEDGVGTPEQFFSPPAQEPVKPTGLETEPPPPTNSPPAPTQPPPADDGKPNPIKEIRQLLILGHFKEDELLRAANVEATSLEQLMLSDPQAVASMSENFGAMAGAIKKMRSAAKETKK